MKTFTEIIIDDISSTFEVLNLSHDDTHLINNISEMRKTNMVVRCDTVNKEQLEDEIIIKGYKREDGLYSRLLIEYEKRTGKSLKRW